MESVPLLVQLVRLGCEEMCAHEHNQPTLRTISFILDSAGNLWVST